MSIKINPAIARTYRQTWADEYERAINEGCSIIAAQRRADRAQALQDERDEIAKSEG